MEGFGLEAYESQGKLLEFEPSPCKNPYSAECDGHHYFWRGLGPNWTWTTIGVYDPHTEKWGSKSTTGPYPPGLFYGGCTSAADCLYCFGGCDGTDRFNDLYKLNLKTLQWSKVHPSNSPSEWPFPKTSCDIVAVDDTTLGCFGGFGIDPSQPLPSSFSVDTRFRDGRGWTNEFHLFDIQRNLWSPTELKGELPLPTCDFTFTKVDRHRAALFGGSISGEILVDSLYIFNFRTMVVTRVDPIQGKVWPCARECHAACCLNYDEEHPKLLVSGGVDEEGKILGDMWILDINSGKWTKVIVPLSLEPRGSHSLTATSLAPGLTEVIMFGGLFYPNLVAAETTILRFEYSLLDVRPPTEKWALVDLATSNTIGSSQRLKEKSEKIKQSVQRLATIKQTEELFNDAIKEGKVSVNITNVLIQGEAGVGKTSTKCILFNKPPPLVRTSTPLAEAPIQFHVENPASHSQLATPKHVTGVRIQNVASTWRVLGDEELREIVTDAIASITVEKSLAENFEQEELTNQTDKPAVSTGELQRSTHDESLDSTVSDQKVDQVSQNAFGNPTTTELKPDIRSSGAQAGAVTNKPAIEERVQIAIASIHEKIVKLTGTKKLGTLKSVTEILGSNWIYFIDSGGQPHFHNLLPHFVHGISAALFVHRLSQKLEEHSMVEYFEDNQSIIIPYRSSLTTEDTLKCLARSMQSHTIDDEKPKLIFVGTFHDKIIESSETLAEKNQKLLKLLTPEFDDQLVFCTNDLNYLIFPLNAKNPSEPEKRIAELIRSEVESSPSRKVDIPIWWYVLEITLKDLSTYLKRMVLSKQECLEVAHLLNISTEALVEALKFFHYQHIFHYYSDILPHVVFTSPQVLLDKLTELVKEAYLMRKTPSCLSANSHTARSGKWKKFRDHGIITLKFLSSFDKHYSDIFTPPDLLKIFMHHLIITPLSSNEHHDFTSHTVQYYMPSLLNLLSSAELESHRVFTSIAHPLLIRFPNGWPRAGVFCCLQVYLIQQLHWKVVLSDGEPKLIAQNCVMLSPPNTTCMVTLIDSFSYFEVHVQAESTVCQEQCLAIRDYILDGINTSYRNLHYSEEQPHLAFFCPCNQSSSSSTSVSLEHHAAILIKEEGFVKCTRHETKCFKVERRNNIWIPESVRIPIEPPSLSGDYSQNVMVKQHESHSLMVHARGTDLTYQWFKDGTSLTDSQTQYLGVNTSKLSINKVSLNDNGKYHCVISNEAGQQVISQPQTLSVVDPPSHSGDYSHNIKVKRHESHSLVVHARGTDLTYQWFKDGTPLTDSQTQYLGVNTSKLSINNLSLKHNGKYHCVISNEAGQQVISQPQTLSVEQEKSWIFSWQMIVGSVCLFSLAMLVLLFTLQVGVPGVYYGGSSRSLKTQTHTVESVRALVIMLGDIGNWEILCTSLGVNQEVLNNLAHSSIDISIKKKRCLESYFDSGHATWEEVIAVVAGPGIHNKRVAKKIADKYQLDFNAIHDKNEL